MTTINVKKRISSSSLSADERMRNTMKATDNYRRRRDARTRGSLMILKRYLLNLNLSAVRRNEFYELLQGRVIFYPLQCEEPPKNTITFGTLWQCRNR